MARVVVPVVLVGVAITGLSACRTVTEPAVARGQLDTDPPFMAEVAPVGAEVEPEGNVYEVPSEQPLRAGPSIRVETAEGVTADEARTALDPFRTRVLECMPNQSGAIRVRIVRTGDGIRMTIQPGTSLNPLTQRCILETLSTLNYDEAWSRSSPADRPAGFSTLLRIEF